MRDRTADLFRAREALSQLSYSPKGLVAEAFQIEARHAKHQDGEAIKSWSDLVGLGRFELPTSPLSGVRSNQLSYRPVVARFLSSCLRCFPRSLGHVLLAHSLNLSKNASTR